MNYNLEMEKQMEKINEGEKILLHACCVSVTVLPGAKLYTYFTSPSIVVAEE